MTMKRLPSHEISRPKDHSLPLNNKEIQVILTFHANPSVASSVLGYWVVLLLPSSSENRSCHTISCGLLFVPEIHCLIY